LVPILWSDLLECLKFDDAGGSGRDRRSGQGAQPPYLHGRGRLSIGTTPLAVKEAKPLPSSD
jgi:hypothetical protein